MNKTKLLAFCQGNQGYANFWAGLQKYVIPAALYYKTLIGSELSQKYAGLRLYVAITVCALIICTNWWVQ